MRFKILLLFALSFSVKNVLATHGFPLVNFNYTVGATGVTVSASSNAATCGGGPYWMQVEVACSAGALTGVMPSCLTNTLLNWNNSNTSYVSYPFFNSLLNIPGYGPPGWNDNCVLEPYHNVVIPFSYFCPGQVMYFRGRELVMGSGGIGPWTSVYSFTVPGSPPAACSASLTHSPASSISSSICPGPSTLTILNPNCPLPCSSMLAPSCITTTVYYKYYSSAGGNPTITTSSTLAIPNVSATTTFSVYKTDSCTTGNCPNSSCNLPGGGWPQTTTIYVSTPNILVSASPNTVCASSNVTLTASGGTSYTWQPGSLTGANVVVNPSVTTTYSVDATSSPSCSSTQTVQVVVSPTPVISVSSSTNVICSGASVTITAGGASSYTWQPGNLTGSSIVVTPGSTTTYSVTGSNGNCTGSNTTNISVISSPTVSAFASSSIICSGNSVNLFAGGASTYTWQPGNLTGAFISVTPASTTIYTVTGSLLSCTDTETVSVAVTGGPTLNVTSSPTTICSASGGSATLTASGAVAYTWTPGPAYTSAYVITPTVTSTYTLAGSNTVGCVSTMTISYSVTPTPTLNITPSSATICDGNSATLTASGAGSYTWMPGNLTSANIVVTPASTTVYTLTGANGSCTDTKTVSVTVNPNPTVTASSSPTVICSGNSSTLSATGAASYTWNPGSITGGTISVSPSSTTNYTVVGSNVFGCTANAQTQVSVITTPTIVPSVNPSTICIGSTATLSATGAPGYTWNPGSLVGTPITVSPASSTIYTVTGANGICTDTKTINLTVLPIPTVTAVSNPTVICAGDQATLTAGGASSYTWSPGNMNGANVSVSPTTNTTYTVVGSNGTCTSSAVVSLSVNPIPTLVATSNPTSICEGSSTTVTLTGSGASTYTWMPGNLSGSNVSVNPTVTITYTLSGTNGFNCSSSQTVNVVVVPIPTLNISASPATICAGNSTTMTATGASSYTWNPGFLTGSAVSVTPASSTVYTVTGETASCSSTSTFEIIVNSNPTITANSSPIAVCAGSASTLSASGAVSYTWNPGNLSGSSVTVNPTSTTEYTVIGSNASNCTSSTAITVSVIPIPTINVSASPTIICIGGTSTLTASGATNYTWSPGSLTGSVVSVSPSSTTTYTVYGENGTCSDTKTIIVTVVPVPTVGASVNPTLVCAGNPATLTGTGASSYTWSPGNLVGASVVVSPTVTTTYTVTGDNGVCTDTETVTLNVNSTPTIIASASPTNICSNSSASSTLTGSGAVSYIWNPGAMIGSNVVVTPTVTTTYTVIGSSPLGCLSTETVEVIVTPTPTLSINASTTSICAGNNVTITASGATNYTWNPGAQTTSVINVSPASSTIYTVTGANGICSSTGTISITVNPNPTVSASASSPTICSGNNTTLTASGASTYTWNPGSLTGSAVSVTPAVTTIYTVTGQTGSCTDIKTVQVTVDPTPTISIISSTISICSGNNVTFTASGASSYTWNPGALTTSVITVSPLSTTVYTVIGSSGNCSSSSTVNITVNPNPTVSVSSNTSTICSGNTVSITASGATTYTWMPGSLTGSLIAVNPTVSTTYTVTGSNGNCTDTKTITINVNPTPTMALFVTGSSTICSGNPVTLNAQNVSTATWQPGNLTGLAVSVSPTITTTYTATGSNGFGCTDTKTVTITVVPTPTISVFNGPNPMGSPTICAGDFISASVTGATSYTWNPGSLTGTAQVLSPSVTTVYTVTGANGNCVDTKTFQINVNPKPNLSLFVSGSNTICSGNGVALNAQGVSSCTWQPGNLVGMVVTVTPTVTTTYTATGSNAFGCTDTKTVTIFVVPTPTVNITYNSNPIGSPTICANTTMSNVTANGATNYTWNPGALTGSVQNLTPTVTTIYTVTGANGNCANSQTFQITVNPSPTVSVSVTSTLVCAAQGVTMTPSGATSYTFYPGGTPVTTVFAFPLSTTSYTFVGSIGSCTNQAVVTISVLPNPVINVFGGPPNICSGSSATLFANGGVSYTWTPGGMTTQSVVVTPTSTTVYTVTGANAAGCKSTATRTINVIPSPTLNPVANPSLVCTGVSSTLTVTGANNYNWFPGPMTGSQVVVTPTATTIYTVTGNIGPCINTKTVMVTVSPTPTLSVSSSSTTVCANSAVSLTATGANTYTWMPGSLSGSLVVVNPLSTAIYTVTGSNASGCSSTKTIQINVSPGPLITINSSTTSICAGGSVTLTPVGATNFTLLPGSLSGTVFIVTPTVTTTYTALGSSTIGCPGVATLQIIVNPIPSITITPSSSGICTGETVTLTASGADTYLWLPSNATTSVITDNPSSTSTYTVIGTSTAGCQSSGTISIGVTPVPTINVSSTASLVCQSGSVGLTATGATNYTWMPGSATGSNVVVNPTVTTIYTVTGNNGGCNSTSTIEIDVTPGPQNITASATGTITCFVGSTGLTGSSTSTNVSYFWNGPASFTSAAQNPTPVTIGGTYTLTVTDPNTGCALSVTTAVTANTAIPNFSVTSSGDLGCNTTVTLIASSSTSAGITYTWSGPGTWTAQVQTPTINVPGDYTVSAFDISTGCVGHLTITINSNTLEPIFNATILPATCNGTTSNNDGTILVSGNGVKFDLVMGSTYTGTATYTNATPIPTTGIITNTLPNPGSLQPYTVRIFGSNGCFKDTTLFLQPVNCNNTIFGLTKAVSVPTLTNNLYQVTYTVTAVNASSDPLTNVVLNENLSVTFPAPTNFTIVSPPVVTSQGSSLTIDPNFDGIGQISLTTPGSSTLLANKRDTIVFTVQLDPNGFFGPFANSVVGFAEDINSLIVTDSSNDGFQWDPDMDGYPTNNNIPTIFNLIPNSRLGIAKAGILSEKLSDNTYDITYVISVRNYGNDTLTGIQVQDSLPLTVPLPANYFIKYAPVASGTLLTINTNYNGYADINLLTGSDTLAPGQSDTIRFTINVTPDTVTVFMNSAWGMAFNTFSTMVRDTSETGYNADPNGNGNPNDPDEADPTVITIPSNELFVPEVFTPNSDGMNDKFVIKGINGRKLKLTVFNRWGNKVYENGEYDNTWEGYPNVSNMVIGNGRLPRGTYYYIIEFQDKDKEKMTGFVVLQY